MSLDAGNILGINITISSKKQILEEIQKYLIPPTAKYPIQPKKSPKTLFIATPNPEQIVYASGDRHFRDLLNRADITLPDGVGITWAIKFLHALPTTNHSPQTISTIPGIDFMENLVAVAARERVPIALIGSWGNLALKAFDCLAETHPGLKGWAEDGPEIEIVNNELRIMNNEQDQKIHNSLFTLHNSNENVYFDQLAKRIIDSGIRIVFVGLGAPKQEYFIEALSHQLSVISMSKSRKLTAESGVIFMSVGGSFDEISGKVTRAPSWVSAMGMKWLWRLILEPWRIKRQLALVKFVWMVLIEKMSKAR
jgi:N-acetylglucosaminyldiphosphoundecaprenol N-acetyl-beta-D-mannosaminyltransferase